MSKKKFQERKQKPKQSEGKSLRSAVLNFFDESPGASYSFKQVARHIGEKNKAINDQLFKLLEELESSGKIEQLADGSYVSTRKIETIEGLVDHVNPKFAYINTGEEHDVYVRTADLNTAMHG